MALTRSRVKKAPAKEGDELTYSYNNMIAVNEKGEPTERKKLYCPECGLARDPELAKRLPCGACGYVGADLSKSQPVFDEETGERLVGEAAKAYRKAQRERAKRGEDDEEAEAPIVVDIKPVLVPPAKPARRNPNEIAPKSVVGFKAKTQKPEEPVIREMYPDRKAAARQSLAELFL